MNEIDTWKWSLLHASLFKLCNVLVTLEIVVVLNCGVICNTVKGLYLRYHNYAIF